MILAPSLCRMVDDMMRYWMMSEMAELGCYEYVYTLQYRPRRASGDAILELQQGIMNGLARKKAWTGPA